VRARQQAQAETPGETDATPAAAAADAAAATTGGLLLASLRRSVVAVRARTLKPEDRWETQDQHSFRITCMIRNSNTVRQKPFVWPPERRAATRCSGMLRQFSGTEGCEYARKLRLIPPAHSFDACEPLRGDLLKILVAG
jgi:hypothetical protein